ncbi:YkgJ family cysteine cluster protein [bacterium]|nr:YkgJ family cysteine cluster protein [bacterium]
MTIKFEAPPNVRYSCTQCGDCCRTWTVILMPGEQEAISALEWKGREERLVGEKTTTPALGPGTPKGRHRLVRTDAGECVFLGEKQQCLIHQHFGEMAKPLLCRLYPFGFYPMGDRVAVPISFFCNAVSGMTGRTVASRTPEWLKLIEESRRAVDRGRHQLSAGKQISGELMWEFESYLVNYLMDRSMTLFQRVRAALEFVRLATTGNPTAPTSGVFREAIAKGVPDQVRRLAATDTMDDSQRAVFYQLLFISLNPTPPNFFEMTRGDQERERQRRLEIGNSFRDRTGRPHVDNRELNSTFEEIDRVGASIFLDDPPPVIETFLCAHIVGQKFLIAGNEEHPLVESTNRFLMIFPMIVWTAKALAADRGASDVELPDIQKAIRFLDRTPGSISFEGLPKKQEEAVTFVIQETGIAVCATNEVLGAEESIE